MMNKTASLLAASVLGITAAPAFADTWDIDGKHSQASFKVKHMMVSNVNGTISGIKGTVDYDGKNIEGLKVDADLDINTINTSEAGRDEHLKGADFFDTAKYPIMKFKSKRVEKKGDGTFQLVGDLTLHGVTKEVALDVEGPTEAITDNKGKQHIGASAKTKVNRKDFGIAYNSPIGANGVAIGETVDVVLDLELIKSGDKKAAK
jgi:polyisoprenoid-binding protein YceI